MYSAPIGIAPVPFNPLPPKPTTAPRVEFVDLNYANTEVAKSTQNTATASFFMVFLL